MTPALPGQGGMLWGGITRDAFLDALGDPNVRVRVLEKDPTTLYDELKMACRLEAILKPTVEDAFDDQGRRRDKFVRVAAPAESSRLDEAARRIEKLEAALGDYRRELDRYHQENACLQQNLWYAQQSYPPTSGPGLINGKRNRLDPTGTEPGRRGTAPTSSPLNVVPPAPTGSVGRRIDEESARLLRVRLAWPRDQVLSVCSFWCQWSTTWRTIINLHRYQRLRYALSLFVGYGLREIVGSKKACAHCSS